MDFSAQAITKILQLFPKLSQFIVSFKDITEEMNREGDDTQAGVCVVSFGGQMYFIPVVAKAGVVQPIDSIFNPAASEFLPMTKGFVENLTETQSLNQMGKSTKIPQTVIQNPSLHNLVVPPRTGKVAYASTGRFIDLLASSSNMVKKAFTEVLRNNSEMANGLDSHFDISSIVQALKSKVESETGTTPEVKVMVITGGDNLSEPEIQSILDKGYAVRGKQTNPRIVVDACLSGAVRQLGALDSNMTFEIVLKSGETRQGTVMKQTLPTDGTANPLFVLFSNGDFSTTHKSVGAGQGVQGHSVLKQVFQNCPPMVPSQVLGGTKVMILTPCLEMAGAFRVNRAMASSIGITLYCRSLVTDQPMTINAYANCTNITKISDDEVIIPADTLMVELGKDIYCELECNPNTAQMKIQMASMMHLGDHGVISHDGVEFTFNNKPVASAASMIGNLIDLGIDPDMAESFMEKARIRKQFKFLMSKKADFSTGDIPTFGEFPGDPSNDYSFGPSMVGNTNQSFSTNDDQTIEATLLAELLQAPDMNEYVSEYLPDIKTSIDRLGRLLLLYRLNMSKMFNGSNASEILALVGSLRNVYRSLGDAYLKLSRLASEPNEPKE
jgi:hypothetical protein